MNPYMGRVALSSGLLIFLLALIVLPALNPESPEYVANILAIIVSGVFLLIVMAAIRLSARPPLGPDPEDD